MNDQHLKLKELQVAFSAAFRTMTNRYMPYQLGLDASSKDSLSRGIGRYVMAFAEEDVTPEEISSSVMEILNDRNFASRPPGPRQLALLIVDKRSGGAKTLHGALDEFFDRMAVRYKGLWHSSEDRARVVDSWKEACAQNGLEIDGIQDVQQALWDDSSYTKYPPSEKTIEQTIGIIANGKLITLPGKAYMAAAGKTKACPLVKLARSAFGAHSLRVRTDLSVKREFEEFYGDMVDDYLKGEITIEQELEVEDVVEPEPEEEILTQDEVISMFRK